MECLKVMSPNEINARFKPAEDLISTENPIKKDATDLATNSPVIWWEFKIPKGDQTTKEAFLKSSRLRHMNIAMVLAFCDSYPDPTSDRVVIITERLETDLLTQTRKQRHFEYGWSDEKVILILGKLIAALSFAQRMEMHHGDVRPSSIFFSTSNLTVKLANFTTLSNNEIYNESIEHSGFTNQYLSPEQREIVATNRSHIYNPHKSDVFSLGLTLLFVSNLELRCHSTSDLAAFIDQQLSTLNRPPALCEVLREMLTMDPGKRPDCIQLESLYMQKWPENQGLFHEPISCSICNRLSPQYLCLCRYPLPLLCDQCWNSHTAEAGEHYWAESSKKSIINDPERATIARDRFKLLTSVDSELNITVNRIDAYISACREQFNVYLAAANEKFDQQMRELEQFKTRAAAIKTSLNVWVAKMTDWNCDLFDYLKQIEKPYFDHKPLSNDVCGLTFPEIDVVEQFSALESVDSPLCLPFMSKSQLVLYQLDSGQKHSSVSVDSDVSIDSDTSLLFVNKREIVGCGGTLNSSQLFTVKLEIGEWNNLRNLEVPRKRAGLAAMNGILYVFGGRDAGTSAEMHKAPLDMTPSSLPQMLSPRSHFSPCVHLFLIYLPGQAIDTYSPEKALYTRLHTLSFPFDEISAVVCDGMLYLFTEKCLITMSIAQKGKGLCRSDANAIKFMSNVAPIAIGNDVWLYNIADKTAVRLSLSNRTVSGKVERPLLI